MITCLYCQESHLQKNGILPKGGQRYKCTDCHKQFSLGGTRPSYTPDFMQEVVEKYCHLHRGVKRTLATFTISSRTLIKRSKQHKSTCRDCK